MYEAFCFWKLAVSITVVNETTSYTENRFHNCFGFPKCLTMIHETPCTLRELSRSLGKLDGWWVCSQPATSLRWNSTERGESAFTVSIVQSSFLFDDMLIIAMVNLQLVQGQSRRLVKAIDNYGLGVAATYNNGSTASKVVQTKNLVMRIDRALEGSPVRTALLYNTSNYSRILIGYDLLLFSGG